MGAPVADVGALTALAALAAGAVGVVGVVVGAVGAVGAAGVVGVAALAALTVGAVGAVGAGAAVAGGAAGASVAALADAFLARVYNFKRYLAGAGAGCACGATLVFNVAAAHLPPEQPRAPVAGPVSSTLEIKLSGGELCRGFNAEKTTDGQERTAYILTVSTGCTVPAATLC
ncbi:MAG: hypothetical protein JNN09_09060 [Alphaproteobacteria bacterium]|nr:hypothetical protein [Alphaproteobacteria bacterium]